MHRTMISKLACNFIIRIAKQVWGSIHLMILLWVIALLLCRKFVRIQFFGLYFIMLWTIEFKIGIGLYMEDLQTNLMFHYVSWFFQELLLFFYFENWWPVGDSCTACNSTVTCFYTYWLNRMHRTWLVCGVMLIEL